MIQGERVPEGNDMVSIPEMGIKSPQEDCTEGTGMLEVFP